MAELRRRFLVYIDRVLTGWMQERVRALETTISQYIETLIIKDIFAESAEFPPAACEGALLRFRRQVHITLPLDTEDLEGEVARRVAAESGRLRVEWQPRWTWIFLRVFAPGDVDVLEFLQATCDGVQRGTGVDRRWFSVVATRVHAADWLPQGIHVSVAQQRRYDERSW